MQAGMIRTGNKLMGTFFKLQLSTGSSLCQRKGARRELFATWLEIRTNVSVSSDYLSLSPPFPILSLYFFLFIPTFPFQSSGGRWALCEYMCSQKISSFYAFILANCLFRLYQRALHLWACRTLDPSTVARTVMFRAAQSLTPSRATGRFHVWSTIKRRQRLISGPRVQIRRGSGVDGNVLRTRKGLNIVFHTWNLTSRVRHCSDLVTPDIWSRPTDTHMFLCGTPSRPGWTQSKAARHPVFTCLSYLK